MSESRKDDPNGETLPAPPPEPKEVTPPPERSDPADRTLAAPSPSPGADETLPVGSPPHGPPPQDPNATLPALPPEGEIEAAAGTREIDPNATAPAAGTSPATSVPPSSPAPLAAEIGGYPIESELGRGGMGIVYRAIDPRLKRPVALKVLTSAIERDSEAYLRFEREAQALATLHHANIATIFSLEEANGAPFFTMEWIEGGTLAHRLERGPLTLEETLSVARQVSRALEAAHARGIVHRDLKPANVMVTPDGTAKILDFGIAAAFGQWETVAPSTAAEVSGTPAYMSPEQYRGEAVDPRTDAWSFGCLLFECCTGAPVFRGSTVGECRTAILEQEPDWSLLPDALPARVESLVRHCLQKDANARLPNLTDARRALEDQLVQEGVTARLAEASPAPSRPATASLPRSLTRFIGREKSVARIRESIEEFPLVTLTGAGGCGKSRLALEAARGLGERFADGIWLVELAAIKNPAGVVGAIAQALSVREIAGEDLETTVERHLDGRHALILLDNCEHLLDECARIVETLLSRLPDLRILASSREALAVPGEEILATPPLRLPREGKRYSLAELGSLEAVQLFLDRARTAKRSFTCREQDAPALAQIVRQLDGIPLAIELAAARIKVLPLEQISKRLDDRFRLLTGGSRTALPRQQTLRATIEWSVDLLEEEERRLLRRLSVFRGGFTLAAVESVCAGGTIEEWEILDRLTLLADKSLVEVESPDEDPDALPRYRLLGTVREYAGEKFGEEPDAKEIEARHLATFLALARSGRDGDADVVEWHRRLDLERANLRAALEFALGDPARSETALSLVHSLGNHWLIRGKWSEGRIAGERAIDHDGERSPADLRASVIAWISRFASSQGDHETAVTWVERGLAVARASGDRPAIASALNDLGVIARHRGDTEEACTRFRESLEIRRELGDDHGIAVALHNLALGELKLLHLEEAESALRESREILEREGNRQRVAVSLALSGSVAFERNDLDTAERIYLEALEIAREIGDRRAQRNLQNNLGMIAELRGDLVEADRRYQESLVIREELGDRVGQLRTLANLCAISVRRGDLSTARERGASAIELFSGAPGEADEIASGLLPLAFASDAHEIATLLLSALERSVGPSDETTEWAERLREAHPENFNTWCATGAELTPDQLIASARRVVSHPSE